MSTIVGGLLIGKLNGVPFKMKGEFTINTGVDKKSTVIGTDGVHGPSVMPQAAVITGATTDFAGVDLEEIKKTVDGLFELQTANGKTYVLRHCWYSGDGNMKTEEGELEVEFSATDCEVIGPT